MYSNMKYYENICNCLRVIQQNINRKLKSANCWQRTSLNSFFFFFFLICSPFGSIQVIGSTALLKLELKVWFLWLLLPVPSGSLKRIDYSKQICWTYSLSFEWRPLLLKELIFIFSFEELAKTCRNL